MKKQKSRNEDQLRGVDVKIYHSSGSLTEGQIISSVTFKVGSNCRPKQMDHKIDLLSGDGSGPWFLQPRFNTFTTPRWRL